MRRRIGVTFIEVLIVVAILVAIAALVFPVYSNAKRAGLELDCVSRLRQIHMALEMYGSEHDGYQPVHRNVDLANSALLRPYPLLLPYLKSTEMFYCPEAPKCARDARKTTYRWVGALEESNPYHESQNYQLDQYFAEPGSGYPVVYCLVHDEIHYYPAERGLSEQLNDPFVVRLLPNGGVKKGRFPVQRDHLIARVCQ